MVICWTQTGKSDVDRFKNQQWSYTSERFVYFCLLLTRLATDRDTNYCLLVRWGHAVAQLVEALRYKPEGSIPDGVIGIFH
jgi:hypothetical protein